MQYRVCIAIALILVWLPTHAAGQTKLSKHNAEERESRRAIARELAEKAVEEAVDPRRDEKALVSAAQGASLAWKIDADLGRRLFSRTLARTEALLGNESTRSATVDVLPSVLSNLANRDSDMAKQAVDRFATILEFATGSVERARLFARMASSLARVNPTAAVVFARSAVEATGRERGVWEAIQALESDVAAPLIDAGLQKLDGENPTLSDLLFVAQYGGLLSFTPQAELGPNATPERIRSWALLAARRLENLRLELVRARTEGRPHSITLTEVTLAGRLGPGLVEAIHRWSGIPPEAAQAAIIELAGIGAPAPYPNTAPTAADNLRAADSATSTRDAENALIEAAFDIAIDVGRTNRETEARNVLARVTDTAARVDAIDDLELVFAAEDYKRGDWPALEKRVARVDDSGLRVRVLGLVARKRVDQGSSDTATAFAAATVRAAARAPNCLPAVAGLVDAAQAFDRVGDTTAATDALRMALRMLDRTDLDEPERGKCFCRPFALSSFDGETVSSGLLIRPANVSFVEALELAAAHDLVGVRFAVTEMKSFGARQLVQLDFVRALVR